MEKRYKVKKEYFYKSPTNSKKWIPDNSRGEYGTNEEIVCFVHSFSDCWSLPGGRFRTTHQNGVPQRLEYSPDGNQKIVITWLGEW